MARLRPASLALSLLVLWGCNAVPTRSTGSTPKKPAATGPTLEAPVAKPVEPPPTVTAPVVPGPVAPTTAPVAPPVAPPPVVAPPAAPPIASLQRPAEPTRVLRGRVTLDASYLVGRVPGGHVTGSGADQAVVVGSLGDAIAAAGGTIIASNGAGIVSSNGGGIVSSNGGGLVSDQGNGIVSSNGGGYHLAQAAEAPAVGTVLPATGMLVRVKSMITGKYLPLGHDAKGEPVFAVLSGKGGAFEVYVPEGEAGNVILDIRPPEVAPAANVPPPPVDRKLIYETLAPPKGADERPVDEDTALIASYLRLTYALRAMVMLRTPDLDAALEQQRKDLRIPADQFPALVESTKQLRMLSDSRGVDKAPPAAAYALVERMADIVAARMDLDGLMISKETYPKWGDRPPQPAIAAVARSLGRMREGARARMAADPTFFASRPYILAANACKAEADMFTIARPSDIGDFMVREYLSSFGAYNLSGAVLADVVEGADDKDPEFDGAFTTVSQDCFKVTEENRGGAANDVVKLIMAFTPENPTDAGPPAKPVPASPCPAPTKAP